MFFFSLITMNHYGHDGSKLNAPDFFPPLIHHSLPWLYCLQLTRDTCIFHAGIGFDSSCVWQHIWWINPNNCRHRAVHILTSRTGTLLPGPLTTTLDGLVFTLITIITEWPSEWFSYYHSGVLMQLTVWLLQHSPGWINKSTTELIAFTGWGWQQWQGPPFISRKQTQGQMNSDRCEALSQMAGPYLSAPSSSLSGDC